MNLGQFLALESDVLLVSVRPGRIEDTSYEIGTVGRISRTIHPDEPPEIVIHFTRTLAFDFAHLERKNWEILRHCARCGSLEVVLVECSRCHRPDYCQDCLGAHNCHIPAIGLSREPRREKTICLTEQRSKSAQR